jgi:hypothetical protein
MKSDKRGEIYQKENFLYVKEEKTFLNLNLPKGESFERKYSLS